MGSDKLATLPSGEEASDLRQWAKDLSTAGGMLPQHITKPGEILAVALTAREMSIPVMTAMRGMYIVNGKVGMSYDLMAAVIQRSGYRLEWLRSDDEAATVRLTDRNDPDRAPHEETFSMDDAKRAGLTRNPTWSKYPKAMLRARALSAAGRAYAADALSGCYSDDETREIAQRVQLEDRGPIKSRDQWDQMSEEDRSAHTAAAKAAAKEKRERDRAELEPQLEALAADVDRFLAMDKDDERGRELYLKFIAHTVPQIHGWGDRDNAAHQSVRNRAYTQVKKGRTHFGINAQEAVEAEKAGSADVIDGEYEETGE